EFVLPVAPTLAPDEITPLLSAAVPRSGQSASEPGGSGTAAPPRIVLTRDVSAALQHARAAVIASGTATVEAALAGTPFVMVYRVAASSYLRGRRKVRVPFYDLPDFVPGRA